MQFTVVTSICPPKHVWLAVIVSCIKPWWAYIYILSYTVLSWCNFSSTGVLNLVYLWNLLFAHSNIFSNSSAIVLDPVYTILAKSDIVLCLYWVKQYICSSTGVLNLMYLWNLLFAHSNIILRDCSAIVLDPVYTILAKSEIVLYVCIGLH